MKYTKTKLALFAFVAGLVLVTGVRAQNIDIHGQAGSDSFGSQVLTLPNGNIVITDPDFDNGTIENVGAVYLYDGASGALIGTMTGGQANDSIGSGGLGILSDGDFLVRSPSWDKGPIVDASALTRCSGTAGCPATVAAGNSLTGSKTNDGIGAVQVSVLPSGNYLVVSPYWDNGFNLDAGAVTWCSKTAGCPTTVTSANSLIGSKTSDHVGYNGVAILSNGNYVVISSLWNRLGDFGTAGAVTFGNGAAGVTGVVSAANSLVGVKMGDRVGGGGVTVLPSGNYVVLSPEWDHDTVVNGGAATFASGTIGISGPITSANSLVGQSPGDSIGYRGITVLTNGNYVVATPNWSDGVNSVGATTWASGTTGITGKISPANSLIGSSASDRIGSRGITALENGNYVVISPDWSNGTGGSVGAVTWGNGAGGSTGIVSAANSIVGSVAGGQVGAGGVFPLKNGNYVVSSPYWRNGETTMHGAATWGNGSTGTSGVVSAANSLVGTTAEDRVSDTGVAALANGNYVVISPNWDSGTGIRDVGAVTWGNGSTGTSGAVSEANSLTGSQIFDKAGNYGVTALTNGNYVVSSTFWANRTLATAGASTWGSGTTGISGQIGIENSLIGSKAGEFLGAGGVTVLSNSNYVISTPTWDNDAADNAGAATWANGNTGITGMITTGNSLAGSAEGDYLGYFGIVPLANSSYIVRSPFWDNGAINSAGAITMCNGSIGTRGAIDPTRSVLGLTADGGPAMNLTFDTVNGQFIVGRPADNIVALWRTAATASVGGRVTNANGAPIANAIVLMVSSGGQRRTAQTGSLGYFEFQNVPTGQSYNVSVSAKRYRFDLPQSVFIDGNLADLNFTAR